MGVERSTYEVDGWGVGEVWLRGGVLVHHELLWEPQAPTRPTAAAESSSPYGGAMPPSGTIAEDPLRDRSDFATSLCRRFHRHLLGQPARYDDVELDLDWCSDFERELAAALRSVSWGEVVTYGELAALAGRPRAARAAGTFCAGNRLVLVLPCHRVVAATGIGGYGASGVPVKRRLLALEGVEL